MRSQAVIGEITDKDLGKVSNFNLVPKAEENGNLSMITYSLISEQRIYFSDTNTTETQNPEAKIIAKW